MAESPLDQLWKEYGALFRDFDDLSLARWCSQTLSQMHGRAWRLSHPVVGCYRLAAQQAHDRQIWLKRLVGMPAGYVPSDCCRAPFLPFFTRDVLHCGLICQHCGDTLQSFEDIPEPLRRDLEIWAKQYAPIHDVAHWDDQKQKQCENYDAAFERAARDVEKLLLEASKNFIPKFLEIYPTIIWEDQDECLEVRPEDVCHSSDESAPAE